MPSSTPYRLLASGYRKTISLLSFDPSSAKLHVESESDAPPQASWLELGGEKGEKGENGQVLYTISEDEENGRGLSAVLRGDRIEYTGERKSLGAPAHLVVLKDGSGIVVANYVGGNIIFLPTQADGSISPSAPTPELKFDFPYAHTKAPNPERQDASHAHQAIQGPDGRIYVCDLGSDRVWVVRKEGKEGEGKGVELKVEGWLQTPPGAGPRHAVFSKDAKHLYVLTELSHEVLIFDLSDPLPSHPKPHFKASVIPPNVPATHSKLMDSAEIQLHPTIPNVLYASNRLELHIHSSQPDLPKLDAEANSSIRGDTVAIILLSDDGLKVEEIKHVRTEADSIRAMRVSPDGLYVALAGQREGGVEIWKVGGKRGDEWKLAGKNEAVDGVTDLVWLPVA